MSVSDEQKPTIDTSHVVMHLAAARVCAVDETDGETVPLAITIEPASTPGGES